MDNKAILDASSIKIAEAQRQRDKARRELSRARGHIRDLLRVFVADMEFDPDQDSERCHVYARAKRFVAR